jgi:hypothetical protein
MNKKLLVISFGLVLALAGCKGKNESRGDEHLAEGRYMNAVNSYTAAEQSGSVSDEFYDNFTLAYVKVLGQIVKKDPMSDAIRGYVEQIEKELPKLKNPQVAEEYVNVLLEVGKAQTAVEGEYEFTLQGFRNLDSAASLAKRYNVAGTAPAQARATAEDAYVKKTITAAMAEDNLIAREYTLLTAAVVAPKNEELNKALNAVRLKTRGDFLIFEAAGIEQPSRWVNTNGYVMAFPSIAISPTGLKGELQFWGATGNNTDLEVEKIKLVSTDGKEVLATQTAVGWCQASDPEGKKKDKLDKKGKLLNESQCSANIAFTYGADFIPDYVEYKDQYGQGRKYLGH